VLRMTALVAIPWCLLHLPPSFGADDSDQKKWSVEELIKRLGSDSFEERETAIRLLTKRKEAVPALRQALQSPDAQIKRSARDILKEIAKAEWAALAKNGQVDLLVERLVHLPEDDDEDIGWQTTLNLVSKLLDLEEKKYGNTGFEVNDKVPFLNTERVDKVAKYFRPAVLDLVKYEHAYQPKRLSGRQILIPKNNGGGLIRAEKVTIEEAIGCNLIVSTGPVRAALAPTALGGALSRSIILAGGNVAVDHAYASVIVCDGDLTIQKGLDNCLIVARGHVKADDLPFGISNCVIMTASTVKLPKQEIGGSAIKEKVANALGIVNFFELTQVGIEVTAAEGGVEVKHVTPNGALARAGLRANDRVSAVDDVNIDGPESLRRVLRRKFALSEPMTLKGQREGQPLKMVVSSLVEFP
jgi:hypothetical protein